MPKRYSTSCLFISALPCAKSVRSCSSASTNSFFAVTVSSSASSSVIFDSILAFVSSLLFSRNAFVTSSSSFIDPSAKASAFANNSGNTSANPLTLSAATTNPFATISSTLARSARESLTSLMYVLVSATVEAPLPIVSKRV